MDIRRQARKRRTSVPDDGSGKPTKSPRVGPASTSQNQAPNQPTKAVGKVDKTLPRTNGPARIQGQGADVADDLFPLDEPVSGQSVPEVAYETLTSGQLWDCQTSIVNQVKEVFELSNTEVRILLDTFKWDTTTLLERYYESEATVLNKARVQHCEKEDQDGGECGICFSKDNPEVWKGRKCGHGFCTDCWKSYLYSQVSSADFNGAIQCPGYGCYTAMDDAFVMEMNDNGGTLWDGYRRRLLNSFVAISKDMRSCPSPGCGSAVRMNIRLDKDTGPVMSGSVTCGACSKSFCFLCEQSPHDPIPCKYMEIWTEQCRYENEDDDDDVDSYLRRTELCPKCDLVIEKAAGGDWIICPDAVCRYRFCWICMNSWDSHGQENVCKWPRNASIQNPQSKRRRERADLVRFARYNKDYKVQAESLCLEEVREKTFKEMLDFLQEELAPSTLKLLQDGFATLLKCRRVLRNTFAFSYFLSESHEKELFECCQKSLQTNVQELSRLLNVNFDSFKHDQHRLLVSSKAKFCEGHLRGVVGHIEEGLKNQTWIFHEFA